MVNTQFVEKELAATLEPLSLPKSGVRMSPAEYSTATNDYFWAQLMQLVYTLLPHPAAFISGKGMDVIQAGGAIIGSSSMGKELGREKANAERIELESAQRFIRPGRTFGTAGQLLPFGKWSEATSPDGHLSKLNKDITTALLISSARPRAQLVFAAALSHPSKSILPMVYDEDWDSPKDIVLRLKLKLSQAAKHAQHAKGGGFGEPFLTKHSRSPSRSSSRSSSRFDHVLVHRWADGCACGRQPRAKGLRCGGRETVAGVRYTANGVCHG